MASRKPGFSATSEAHLGAVIEQGAPASRKRSSRARARASRVPPTACRDGGVHGCQAGAGSGCIAGPVPTQHLLNAWRGSRPEFQGPGRGARAGRQPQLSGKPAWRRPSRGQPRPGLVHRAVEQQPLQPGAGRRARARRDSKASARSARTTAGTPPESSGTSSGSIQPASHPPRRQSSCPAPLQQDRPAPAGLAWLKLAVAGSVSTSSGSHKSRLCSRPPPTTTATARKVQWLSAPREPIPRRRERPVLPS